jgi:hypothetical protein
MVDTAAATSGQLGGGGRSLRLLVGRLLVVAAHHLHLQSFVFYSPLPIYRSQLSKAPNRPNTNRRVCIVFLRSVGNHIIDDSTRLR